ncbi:MAG: SDR family NAD(P)-dependent oxidoreductase [Acholeplasmatales bacterium]|nr:SDR family NAD(P)-dependent oxidoreductase [Acholeplasmatales bacterium]
MPKVILITGVSSGFGADAAKLLVKDGHIVYGVARNVDKLNELEKLGIKTYKLDVTNYDESKKVVDEIVEREGRIDVLVNNAGYGELGPIEAVSIENAKKQMEVNVFALANMCKLVIPTMRNNHSGRIINISSVAGRVSTYLGGWYTVSKYSVEALTNSLRMELKQFGISVTAIEPGPFKTNWGVIAADNIEKTTKGTIYESEGMGVAKFYKETYKGSFLVQDGFVVGKKIYKVAIKKHVRARYLVGRFTWFMVFGSKILPTRLFDKIARSTKKK